MMSAAERNEVPLLVARILASFPVSVPPAG